MIRRAEPWIILIAGIIWCLLVVASHAAEIAIGDSIAAGLGLPGSAKVGIGPKEVVRRIAMTPLRQLHDNIVVLSTGLSNNPDDDADVELEIEMLHAVSARVVLLGVGIEVPNSLNINHWLKDEAEFHNWVYIDGWEDVHPPDYRALLENIRMYTCMARWECDI